MIFVMSVSSHSLPLCPLEVDFLGRPKAGEPEEVREAVLGEHRLMSSPLYGPLLPA
jgi:hypothetical protein